MDRVLEVLSALGIALMLTLASAVAWALMLALTGGMLLGILWLVGGAGWLCRVFCG